MTQAICTTPTEAQRRPRSSQIYQRSVAFAMAQNRSISNGVARAAYACSLAVHCGLVLGL